MHYYSERNAFRRDPGRIVQVKITEFCSTQTVMALYDQEVARNNGEPNQHQQLKTAVKLHIDQMMQKSKLQSPNTMLWNEDQLPRVKKETKPTLRGKWESVFSRRHKDNVPKETLVVSVMTSKCPLETRAKVRDEKDDRLLPHPIRRRKQTDGEEQKSSQGSGNEQENSIWQEWNSMPIQIL